MTHEKKYIHFKLIQILKEETDKDHPMKQIELANRLGVNRSTVSRALGDLILDSENSHVYSVNQENELDDDGNSEDN